MKDKPRILFIDIIDRQSRLQNSYPHLGIGYLIAYLKKNTTNDFHVRVVNSDYLKHVRSFKPNIVALSSVTQNFNNAIWTAKEIKQVSATLPIVIGGVHISSLPHSLDKNMDVGVIGEGEETFKQLIEYIFFKCGSFEQLDDIDGLVFWRGNNRIVTKSRQPLSPLDRIPQPCRSVLPNNHSQFLLTSRGCPYRCAFCSSAIFWEKARYFSCEYLLEEIEQIIASYPVLNMTIYDDLFVSNKKRLAEISSRIVAKGLDKKVNFWCNARADILDEETIGCLKRMNVKGVGMGLESGSNAVLSRIKGGNASIENNRRAIELCRRNGLFVHGSFMLGCPGESEEDMLKTYEFIRECSIDKGEISVATPLPGTSFWDYALQKGLVSTNMDWSKLAIRFSSNLSMLGSCILLTDKINKSRFIEIFRDITTVLEQKVKDYESKWQRIQGEQVNFGSIFLLANLKKFINDPSRGARYLCAFILTLPRRLFVRLNK